MASALAKQRYSGFRLPRVVMISSMVKRKKALRVLLCAACGLLASGGVAIALADDSALKAGPETSAQQGTPSFAWFQAAPGYSVGRFSLGSPSSVLRPEILLVKFDPKRYSFRVLRAEQFGTPLADVQSIVNKVHGVAGINAHFFDTEGKPLGLLIDGGQVTNRLHKGGALLTGIFMLESDHPTVIERNQLGAAKPSIALQAGPRLIENFKPLEVAAADTVSRRSGIAITDSDEVILFATMLRFPGASLHQVQEMLMHPALKVREALNLDGGGSSQLYVRKNNALADDTFVTGGDQVPTTLVVTERPDAAEKGS